MEKGERKKLQEIEQPGGRILNHRFHRLHRFEERVGVWAGKHLRPTPFSKESLLKKNFIWMACAKTKPLPPPNLHPPKRQPFFKSV
jgi:hypothetical protein